LHLSDFGFAKNTNPDYSRFSSSRYQKGTIAYMAPESHLEEQKEKPVINKLDVWSIGVIAY
jgi:serine/threonine protein kinase